MLSKASFLQKLSTFALILSAGQFVFGLSASEVRSVKIESVNDQSANVVLIGNGAFRYHAFELASPQRLVIDLESVTLAPACQKILAGEQGIFSKVRLAQYTVSPNVVRAVIDLNRKATYDIFPISNELRIQLAEISTADVRTDSVQPSPPQELEVTKVLSSADPHTPIVPPTTPKAQEIPSTNVKHGRLWSIDASVSSGYDSNVNQDIQNLKSVGIVYGVSFNYKNRPAHPTFQLGYDLNRRSYSETDRWDRISQDLDGIYKFRLSKQVSLATEGEINLKGSTEDHEIANQYIAKPQLIYRLTRSTDMNFYAAYRLRRYPDPIDLGRDSINRYAGIAVDQDIGRHNVELGFRYETNHADSPRNTYIRWTYSAEYRIAFNPRNTFSFEARYRPQHYLHRLVDVGDLRLPRRDQRWAFTTSLVIALAEHWDLMPRYKYETRSSNDPVKEFNDHLPSITLRYRW